MNPPKAASPAGTQASESSDGRRVRGDRTKRAILDRAVALASTEGLEGLSIGRLALELSVSKSGLFAHFGSKQELQLETIDAASVIFEERVWGPVADAEPGLARLEALIGSWLDYLRSGGGCFFSNVEHEFDGRPGPVRDRIAHHKQRWMDALVAYVRRAQQRGEVREKIEPEQLAFELDAMGLLANSLWQLNDDPHAFVRAWTGVSTRLRDSATPAGGRVLDGLPERPQTAKAPIVG